jgi:hypothetical protein
LGKVVTIKEFAELGLFRLDRALKDLTEEQLDWQSCSEANTIRNILTHLVYEWNGFIPRIVAGDKDAKVKGVPEGYIGNQDLSLEDILRDIADGKIFLLEQLCKVKDEDLKKEMDWFMGLKNLGFYLMLGVSEIIHHGGQIAAIRGMEKRLKGI